jgi:putative transposase
LIDENGQSLVCSLKRTWAPRGHTPKIRTSIQHNQRINTIAALLVTPGERKIRLRAKSYECNLTGDQVIDFLQHLLQHVRGPIVLVWDKAPIHQRKKVQEFLAQHPRVHVYNFPTSAPELNPVEFVWTQMEDYLASRAPRDIKQLRTLIRAALHRTRTSQSRLWSCIYASGLPWKRKIMRH